MNRPVWILLVLTSMAALLPSCHATKVATSMSSNPHAAAVVEGAAGAQAHEYLSRLEALGFSGAVLVARKGEVLLHQGYGLADRDRGVPYTVDTVSTVGSITKQFTAAAVMALVEDGRLALDDPLTDFFDGVPEDKRAITVHQLLTHSAGFRGAIGDDLERIGRDAYLQQAMASPLQFTPGSRYDYSNVGYSILAAILEKVSGKAYEEVLRDEIVAPAGLRDTGYQRAGVERRRLAVGVQDGERWGTIAERTWGDEGPGWHLVGNGGIVSTVADLYRWHLALQSGAVLSAESRRKIFTPWIREGEDADSFYGYGWAIWLDESEQPRLIAHNGGNGIFAADFLYYPKEDLVIIGMSNVSDRSFITISQRVARLVRGEEVTMPPAVVELDAAILQPLAGRYEIDGSDGAWRLSVRPQGILLQPDEVNALRALETPPSERVGRILDERSAETTKILEATFAGDYGPLQRAFGGPPLEEVKERAERNRASLESRLGALQRQEVVHAGVDRGRVAVLARLAFERGSAWLQYLWGPGGLNGIRVLDELPAVVLHPTGNGRFASYDFRTGDSIGVTVENGRLAIERKEQPVITATRSGGGQ